MKALTKLIGEVERKVESHLNWGRDFEKLSAYFLKHHFVLPSGSLKKVWHYVKGAEKPSKETLDKLALFVGFQSWDDFKDAFNGEADDDVNYE